MDQASGEKISAVVRRIARPWHCVAAYSRTSPVVPAVQNNPLRPRLGAAALVVLVAASAGCGLLRPRAAARPPRTDALPPPKTPLRVALLWSDPVDLDLYVTDPALETVYFANNPSGSGGRLKKDVECTEAGRAPEGRKKAREERTNVETVSWKAPAPGGYRVGVDYIDACESGLEEVRFRIVADARGERHERSGTLRFERFEAVVLEFDLPGKSGEESKVETPRTEAK